MIPCRSIEFDESTDRLTIWLLAKCLTAKYGEPSQWYQLRLGRWRKFQVVFLFPLLSMLRRVWNRVVHNESNHADNPSLRADLVWREFLNALDTIYQEKSLGFGQIIHRCRSYKSSSATNIAEDKGSINVNRGEP